MKIYLYVFFYKVFALIFKLLIHLGWLLNMMWGKGPTSLFCMLLSSRPVEETVLSSTEWSWCSHQKFCQSLSLPISLPFLSLSLDLPVSTFFISCRLKFTIHIPYLLSCDSSIPRGREMMEFGCGLGKVIIKMKRC